MSAQPDTSLIDALMARNNPGVPPIPGTDIPDVDPNSSPPGSGELPGAGYAFADDPGVRQLAELQTTPERVRQVLLRSMETAAINIRLVYAEQGDPAKQGDLLLKCAQAYLLIDPLVDALTGVPVVTQAVTQAAGQMAAVQAQPAPQEGVPRPAGGVVGQHVNPPRVQPESAQILSDMHQNLQTVLEGARSDRPGTRPRP